MSTYTSIFTLSPTLFTSPRFIQTWKTWLDSNVLRSYPICSLAPNSTTPSVRSMQISVALNQFNSKFRPSKTVIRRPLMSMMGSECWRSQQNRYARMQDMDSKSCTQTLWFKTIKNCIFFWNLNPLLRRAITSQGTNSMGYTGPCFHKIYFNYPYRITVEN